MSEAAAPRDVPDVVVHRSLGWSRHDEAPVYLHGSGAIGAGGAVDSCRVDLPPGLKGFALPAPPEGDDEQTCVIASLSLLDLGPSRIMVPLMAAVYRSVLAPSDFSIHLVGKTGTFKTELAALIQQHFGAEMSSRELPCSWESTPNSLEELAFHAREACLVVDDFAPGVENPTFLRGQQHCRRPTSAGWSACPGT